MYKKIITLIAACFSCTCLLADTPGKAAMHDSRISFQGIKNIPNYIFYWAMENAANADAVTTDSSFYMSASHGAPYSYSFWGVNTITKKSTDTIHFHNYYSPDYVVLLNAVKEDSIYYSRKELSNANEILNEGNTDSIANKQLIADARAAKRKHYTKIDLLIATGIAALGGLTWFFIRRRKKKPLEHG